MAVTRPQKGLALALGLGAQLAAAALLAPATAQAPALAAGLVLPGGQTAVACLATGNCVVVGRDDERATGDVIVVADDKASKPSVVAGTESYSAISCPSGVGCIALGGTNKATDVVLSQTDIDGTVLGSNTMSVPNGVTYDGLSCYSVYLCRLIGTDRTGGTVVPEFGDYNRRAIIAKTFPLPEGYTQFSAAAISCYVATCASAGTARVDEKSEGLVFVSVGDDLEQTTTFAGDVMVGASCVSTTLCYAAGNGAHGGFVVPINSGVVGAPYNAPAVKLSGLACQPQVPATAPASCLAVGSERQGPSTYGTLVSLMGSRVTPPSIVRASGGFTSVAAQPASPGFAALGPAARGPGCEVTLVG